MYTINSAYAMRQEKVTGSLVVGKEADLIVVDRDIFAVAQDELDKAVVLQTVLQGEEVWRHKNFKS
jgi:predicted amidohydrolase YtcJ